MTVARRQRRTRIKSNVQIARHQWIVREALVLRCVRHDKHLRLHDRMGAERVRPRRFLQTESKLRFEPLAVPVDQTDQRNWHTANEGGQLGQIIEPLFRSRVENLVSAQRRQAFRFIGRYRIIAHFHNSRDQAELSKTSATSKSTSAPERREFGACIGWRETTSARKNWSGP